MPRTPVDYSRTVIYKIICNDLTITDLYVGSTTNFADRKTKHKSDCKTKGQNIYNIIRANGNWDNWSMVEIEKYPCADGNAARSRERFWVESLNAKLNSQRPIISSEELIEYQKAYYAANSEEKNEYMKLYHSTHSEEINARQKAYYAANREEFKEKSNAYNAANSEKKKENDKAYYAANREEINARQKAYYAKKRNNNI